VQVDLMGIGELARRSRLSPKALRLYDELGLLMPARVDDGSGYRYYSLSQLDCARLIAASRQLQIPLAEIKSMVDLEPGAAADRITEQWNATEARHTARRDLANYLIDRLQGKRHVMYEVTTRDIPERSVPCVKRSVEGIDGAWTFGKEFISILRNHDLPRVDGRAGSLLQHLVGRGQRRQRGPLEWCRPVPTSEAERLAAEVPELVDECDRENTQRTDTWRKGKIPGIGLAAGTRHGRETKAVAPQVGITLARGDSVRSPVAGRARSRVRREDVGDGSAAEGGGAHGLDGEGCGEQRLAGTEDDRVDDEAVLVDQPSLDERSSEPDAALREQVSA
jgi:DNA-binding transcriptional MerR regulator